MLFLRSSITGKDRAAHRDMECDVTHKDTETSASVRYLVERNISVVDRLSVVGVHNGLHDFHFLPFPALKNTFAFTQDTFISDQTCDEPGFRQYELILQ